jgi:hypothetical protein
LFCITNRLCFPAFKFFVLCFQSVYESYHAAIGFYFLLLMELVGLLGWARWVSPVLRAPIPAALCHGARGPERRRA